MIADTLPPLKARISSLAHGRPVRLLAASKSQPREAIEEALVAGHRLFGENKVQEATEKYPPLRASFPDLELHLIGPLQTNKVRQAIALFDAIQTLDRPELARALAKEMARQNKRPRLFIEVNIGEEPQKAGITPSETASFFDFCRKDAGLDICGLMVIPPANKDPAPYFRQAKGLADALHLKELSMGMSGDFPAALACGATLVRIGTAFFGLRAPCNGCLPHLSDA